MYASLPSYFDLAIHLHNLGVNQNRADFQTIHTSVAVPYRDFLSCVRLLFWGTPGIRMPQRDLRRASEPSFRELHISLPFKHPLLPHKCQGSGDLMTTVLYLYQPCLYMHPLMYQNVSG